MRVIKTFKESTEHPKKYRRNKDAVSKVFVLTILVETGTQF